MGIPIRELKATLSRVMARAQAGEVIEVTSHRKPIARIVGVPLQAEEGLKGLLLSGAVSWNGAKPAISVPLALKSGGKPVSEIILEDRS
jgi:prevent-host-death family protein